jgi:DNA-binding MarR family transcriptional regulator
MKNPDLQPPEFEVWKRLITTADAARETVENALKENGFPPLTWYDVLLELGRLPNGGLRPYELEKKLLLSQYNLSRLLDRIVRDGYAEKTTSPDDRRGHSLSITSQGRTLINRMWPVYRSAVEGHFGDTLSPPETAMLTRLLDRLHKKTGDKVE